MHLHWCRELVSMNRSTIFATALALFGTLAACSASSDEGDETPGGELGQSEDEVREVIPGPVVRFLTQILGGVCPELWYYVPTWGPDHA